MQSILESFEATVARCGNRPAVTDTRGSYTYGELQIQARVAGTAIARQITRQQPVVIFEDKSCQAMALLYGAIYAGGFYVFVSPEQPAERIHKILSDMQPGLVITQPELKVALDEAGYDGKIAFESDILSAADGDEVLTQEHLSKIDNDLLAQRRAQADPEDILYGIYTSGSTGDPKGIIVSHQCVYDFIGHFSQMFHFAETDVIGNQAPFDFDVSIKDIFTACMTGAEIVLIPKQYFAMPKQLLDYIIDKHVTSLVWAVSAMCMISGLKGFRYRIPTELRQVMFSGEVMPPKQLRVWQDALPETQFVNLYGPSEITCNATYYPITRQYEDSEKLPIGQPFPGRKIFLLDHDHQMVTETGKVGELCVAGESIAPGYYHNPTKTAEQFVTALMDGQMVRFYKTGDMASLGEDGLYYFEGREDAQIKHMGHRIELGEVEIAMMEIEAIDRVCCLYNHKKSQIIGFYVGNMDVTEVRAEMKEKLPGYMIPNKLMQLEEFKLNKNGKIDRNELKVLAKIS